MERDARARRDFVTQREADDELAAVYAGCSTCSRAVGQCEQCRQQRGARMPLGQHMAVVSVERVDRRCAGKRGASHSSPPAIEQDACVAIAAAKLRRGIRVRNRSRACPATGGGDTDQVEQAALRACDYRVG